MDSSVIGDSLSNTQFTQQVGTGQIVPHFMIKVPTQPNHGWGAAMVQFSLVVAQLNYVHTIRDLQPGQPGHVV